MPGTLPSDLSTQNDEIHELLDRSHFEIKIKRFETVSNNDKKVLTGPKWHGDNDNTSNRNSWWWHPSQLSFN